MSSTCRRPGCGRPAVVTIRYDPVSCQLWLDPINPADRNGQFLCLDHAERLSPPRGWVVVDRRGAQTAIRTPVAVAPRPRLAPRRAVRRRWGSFEEPTLQFTLEREATDLAEEGGALVEVEPAVEVDVEVDVDVEVEAEPVGAPAPPAVPPEPSAVPPQAEARVSQPEPDPDPDPDPDPEAEAPVDDLSSLLKPRGGLLGRAFESTGHQRSALTITDDT